jgi:hypothetical protein
MLARHCLVFLRDMSNEMRGLARHDRVLAAVVGDQSFDRPCLTPLVGALRSFRRGGVFTRGSVRERSIRERPCLSPGRAAAFIGTVFELPTMPFRLPTRPAPT